MKKLVLLLTGIIVISNAIWSCVYFSDKGITSKSSTDVQIYMLNGTGNLWDVNDYSIVISDSEIFRGSGTLVYKGEPQNLENSTYYKYEFKELSTNNINETVYVFEAVSENGRVSILQNLNIGSITGGYSYDELKKNNQNYESTTVTITWNDNEGQMHTETVNLDIDREITLD